MVAQGLTAEDGVMSSRSADMLVELSTDPAG
jgi:hypothetical protein